MADDVHVQSQAAVDQSPEWLVRELTELKRRQMDCEDVIHCAFEVIEQNCARLNAADERFAAGYEWRRQYEQTVKEAFASVLGVRLLTGDEQQEEEAREEPAASGDVGGKRKRHLRLIAGGLAAIATAGTVLAAPVADAVADTAGSHQVTAVHCYVRTGGCVSRDADPRLPGIQVGT